MMLCTFAHAFDSHELIVESTGVGALDSVIYGDTLPDGNRADMDRITVLRRPTKYILSRTIEWSGSKGGDHRAGPDPDSSARIESAPGW